MDFAILHSFRTSHGPFSALACILCKYLSLILLGTTLQLVTLFNYPQPLALIKILYGCCQNFILKTHQANFWLASSSELFQVLGIYPGCFCLVGWFLFVCLFWSYLLEIVQALNRLQQRSPSYHRLCGTMFTLSQASWKLYVNNLNWIRKGSSW